jgi:succinate dehydrogenase/fumarate reductase flavoprotein subunit/carbon monoxide dehydrogenase subunit G
MKIVNYFELDEPAGKVFELLVDLEKVAQCLPGARIGIERPDGAREGQIEVRFGPMRFTYGGTLKIIEIDQQAQRAVMSGRGSEVTGEGTAQAEITMAVSTPHPQRTRVDVSTDLLMSGGVAQIGNGLIEDIAQEVLEDFVQRLKRVLRGGSPTSIEEARHDASSAATRAVSSTAPGMLPSESRPAVHSLSAGELVLRIVRRRTRRYLKKFAARGRRLRAAWGQDQPETVPASVSAPVSPSAARPEPTLDLAVVGTGSGALAAAILAHDAGLRVAIFEKAPVVGGGTAYSGGVVWAPNNHIMQRKGIPDSTEEACEYLRLASGDRGDADLQRQYAENVGPIIEQVEKWTGVKWVIWTGQPDYYPDLPGAKLSGRAILPHPASASDVLLPLEESLPGLTLVRPTPHMDFVPGFQMSNRPARHSWLAGRSIIGGLWRVILERGIEYHVSTPMVGLLRDGDKVVGLEVEPDGQPRRKIYAYAVLLNTGGFDWNDELARRYLPGPVAHPQTPPSNTGDGHIAAMKVGAGTALMDKAVWHPSIQIPGDTHDEGAPLYRMFNMELSKPHAVVVNSAGKRFSTEAAYYALADAWAHIDTLSRTYPNIPSFLICDEQYKSKYGFPGMREGDPAPSWICSAPTLPGLAKLLGIDGDALVAQVERYNADCVTGVDTEFARGENAYERYWGDPAHDGPNPTMGPIEKAPFYGFETHLAHAGTRGGVLISVHGQVLQPDGTPIPGLYASGNTAANQLFGAGYASGSAVGSSLVFGYLAGRHVIETLS